MSNTQTTVKKTAVDKAVERYVASWGEPDPAVRRGVVAELWSPEAVYKNSTTEYFGLDGIETAVAEAYEMFMSKGYVTKVRAVDTNHEAVRYTWELTAPGGTEPIALGTQIVTLDADGRMVRDHQFLDKAPTGLID